MAASSIPYLSPLGIYNIAASPASARLGDLYFNSTINHLQVCTNATGPVFSSLLLSSDTIANATTAVNVAGGGTVSATTGTFSGTVTTGATGITLSGTQGATRILGSSNLVLNAAASNPLYLNWDSGSGGIYFGNGSGGQAGYLSNVGLLTLSGGISATTGTFSGLVSANNGLVVNNGSREITLQAGTGSILIQDSTGGWAEGLFIQNNAQSSNIAGFGVYGTADVVNYHYLGANYASPLFKVDNSGNGTFTGSGSFGSNLAVNGYLYLENGGTTYANLYGNQTQGLGLYGNGSVYDFSLVNYNNTAYILTVPHGTQNLNASGALTVAGLVTATGGVTTGSQILSIWGSTNLAGSITSQNSTSTVYGTMFAEGSNGNGVNSWANSFVLEGVPATGGNTVISSYNGSFIVQVDQRGINALTISSTGAAMFAGTSGDSTLQVVGTGTYTNSGYRSSLHIHRGVTTGNQSGCLILGTSTSGTSFWEIGNDINATGGGDLYFYNGITSSFPLQFSASNAATFNGNSVAMGALTANNICWTGSTTAIRGVVNSTSSFYTTNGSTYGYGISTNSTGGLDIMANQAGQNIAFYAGTANNAGSIPTLVTFAASMATFYTPISLSGSVNLSYPGNYAMRTNTLYGYCDIGPQNSSYCHIYSGLPFYFNQGITTTGNMQAASYSGGGVLAFLGEFPTANSQDFNALKTPGYYDIVTGNYSGTLDAPTGNYGVLSITGDSNFINQYYNDYSNAQTYTRQYYIGTNTWTPWVQFYTTGNINTSLAATQALAAQSNVPNWVTSLPSLPNGIYPSGSAGLGTGCGALVCLTTTKQMYQNQGGSWVTVGNDTAIYGSAAFGVIAAGSINATALVSNLAMVTTLTSGGTGGLYVAGTTTAAPTGFKMNGTPYQGYCWNGASNGAFATSPMIQAEFGTGVSIGGYDVGSLALGRLVNAGIQVFTSSGSWVCPPHVTQVEVSLVGGGGGGCVYTGVGGGGGGGGFIRVIVGVTQGNTYNITVGAGGASTTTSTGNPGGSSIFPADAGNVTAIGGSGASTTNGGAGGGATCVSPIINIAGQAAGSNGATISDAGGGPFVLGGGGGCCGGGTSTKCGLNPLTGGAAGNSYGGGSFASPNANGGASSGYGCGGSGLASGTAYGGGAGVVILRW